MSNIFIYFLNYKRNLKRFSRLIANIYQEKVDSIILLKSNLCMLPMSSTQVLFYKFCEIFDTSSERKKLYLKNLLSRRYE